MGSAWDRGRAPEGVAGKLGVLEVGSGGDVVLVKGAIDDLSLDEVVIAEERPA